jgi:hypothetical protein
VGNGFHAKWIFISRVGSIYFDKVQPDNYPITKVFSSAKSYSGISKLSGAGPFRARPATKSIHHPIQGVIQIS